MLIGSCAAGPDAESGRVDRLEYRRRGGTWGKRLRSLLTGGPRIGGGTRTQCYICAKIGLTPEQTSLLVNELKEISKMLTGLARSLKTEN